LFTHAILFNRHDDLLLDKRIKGTITQEQAGYWLIPKPAHGCLMPLHARLPTG
jgi:hypothetical protein